MTTPYPSFGRHRPGGLKLLYEDRDLLVVDKPSGLLTMGTERDKTRTAYCLATDYVRKGNPKSRNRVFIVHRLYRDTSGVLLFAKTEAAKEILQGQWEVTEKKYLAIVHGHLARKEGTISTYLAENSAHNVYSTTDPQKGKLSHTAYRVLKEAKEFSLVEIDLLTGRKNQIRVHFAGIGHPVVGDRKYGREKTSHPRLALHARSISFPHPLRRPADGFRGGGPGTFCPIAGKDGGGRSGSDAVGDPVRMGENACPAGERGIRMKIQKVTEDTRAKVYALLRRAFPGSTSKPSWFENSTKTANPCTNGFAFTPTRPSPTSPFPMPTTAKRFAGCTWR